MGAPCSSFVVQFLKKVIASGWRPVYFHPQIILNSLCPKNIVPSLLCDLVVFPLALSKLFSWWANAVHLPGVRAGLLRVALITHSAQRGPWGVGKSLGTPDALATPGLCSESCVQRRDLFSLAAEPSLSWRWDGLILLRQDLAGKWSS